jgi:hypothetical protein
MRKLLYLQAANRYGTVRDEDKKRMDLKMDSKP